MGETLVSNPAVAIRFSGSARRSTEAAVGNAPSVGTGAGRGGAGGGGFGATTTGRTSSAVGAGSTLFSNSRTAIGDGSSGAGSGCLTSSTAFRIGDSGVRVLTTTVSGRKIGLTRRGATSGASAIFGAVTTVDIQTIVTPRPSCMPMLMAPLTPLATRVSDAWNSLANNEGMASGSIGPNVGPL